MTERRTPLRAAVLAIALLAVAVFAAQAQAATYTVGTTSDTTPGTACPNFPNGCSLRQLIEFENNRKPPVAPDTIIVPAGYYGISNAALTITQGVSITGAGARTTEVQKITTTDRVFDVQVPNFNGKQTGPVPTVSISGLEILGGTTPDSGIDGFYGGDVRNQGTLTLSEDWITGGSAPSGSGAGVGNDGGTLTVTHSLISGNVATCCGGDSGGIQNYGPNPFTGTAGKLFVDNSTIAGNTAALGGGIFSWGDNGNTTSIVNSTIAYNDGGNRSTTGGGLLVSNGTISVQNSIVASNTVDTPSAGSPSNCGGSITSLGYNLESGTDCGFTAGGDLQSTDPGFTSATPQDNGGNTGTLGLHAASPAIDAIPPAAPNCGGTDQLDVTRPQGAGCDIGAVELFQPTEQRQASLQVAVARCQVFGSVTINWGDGTSSQDGTKIGRIIAVHTYAEGGIYTGSVSWSDDCGNHNTSFDVKVIDAALTATGGSINAGAGSPFSGPVATLTDADPGATATHYATTINWGDGTTSPGSVTGSGPFVVNGTHTYASGGSYPVTVSISDPGGATATATGTATVTPQSQPAVTPGKPSVISTTSAAFSTTVNPDGLVTSVVFQYGPALAGAGDVSHLRALAASPTYTSSTPAQTIAPDYSNHTITTTVTGLLPNTTYHVRAVASNSAGTTAGPDQTVTTPADPLPPPPTLGKTFNLAPVSGIVLIKIKNTFVPLTEVRQIPANTPIDALHGTIQVISAGTTAHTASGKGQKSQKGIFGGAIFKVTQARSGASKGQTTLSLVEGAFAGAPTYASCKAHKATDLVSPFAHAAALSSKVLQTLKASAHGHFRTRGRYSAATVRGTKWTTADRCDGTLTSVQKDTVLVTDFALHKNILLHAGQHYLARAPSHRRK